MLLITSYPRQDDLSVSENMSLLFRRNGCCAILFALVFGNSHSNVCSLDHPRRPLSQAYGEHIHFSSLAVSLATLRSDTKHGRSCSKLFQVIGLLASATLDTREMICRQALCVLCLQLCVQSRLKTVIPAGNHCGAAAMIPYGKACPAGDISFPIAIFACYPPGWAARPRR